MCLYLVLGVGKSGTTIISKTIHHSIPESHFHMEPRTVGVLEALAEPGDCRVVKILYGQWETRPHLLDALILGETEFKADKTVAIVRDPRDCAVSGMMYAVYSRVLEGASRSKVERWVDCVLRKEAEPDSLTLFQMMEEMHKIFGTSFNMLAWIKKQFEYMDWLARHRDRLFVVHYEDFVAGDNAELENYLGFKLSASRDIGDYDRVRRTQGSGNWKVVMLPEDLEVLREKFSSRFDAFGYTDWELSANARLDPTHGSEYILRVAEAAFAEKASATPLEPPANARISKLLKSHWNR